MSENTEKTPKTLASLLEGKSRREQEGILAEARKVLERRRQENPYFGLQPKQKQLTEVYENSQSTWIGMGGARGGSKSHIARKVALARRLKYPNTEGAAIRQTLDDLKDNLIRPLLKEHPYLNAWYNKQDKIISFPNGSSLRFVSADHYDAVFEIIGKNWADIAIDQAEQFSEEQLIHLKTNNRCATNLDIVPKMLLTFNPGNIGHSFLKRIFVEKEYQGKERRENYEFVRAYGWDNSRWVKAYLIREKKTEEWYYSLSDEERFQLFIVESKYGSDLDALPDSQRKAQLLGDFDIFEGQFLSMWRREYHIVPNNETYSTQIDTESDLFQQYTKAGLIDYGARTCLTLGFRDYEGRIICFAENWTEDMVPSERFNRMADLLIEKKLYKLMIGCDTNMGTKMNNYMPGSDKSPLEVAREIFRERMGENAPNLFIVIKSGDGGRGYRIICNEAMKEFLHWKKDEKGNLIKKPKLYFTSDCKMFIKTAPLLITDSHSQDGLDFDQSPSFIDDAYDSVKMLLMLLWKPTQQLERIPEWYEDIEGGMEYVVPSIFDPFSV